jgi:hypothetical protein
MLDLERKEYRSRVELETENHAKKTLSQKIFFKEENYHETQKFMAGDPESCGCFDGIVSLPAK